MAAGVDVILMDINLPGMTGVEALAALRAAGVSVPVLAFTALRDERRPRRGCSPRASTATSRSPSTCARCPARSRRCCRDPRRRRPAAERAAAAGGARAARARGGRGVLGRRRRWTMLAAASTSCCSTSSCRGWTATRCAGAIRADPATEFLPGDDDHGRRRAGEAPRAGRGRRRLHRQAVRPGRAARARALAAARSSATTTRSSATRPACGASSRPRSPTWSRPTRPCWRRTAARWRCSSAAWTGSPRSPRPPRPRT